MRTKTLVGCGWLARSLARESRGVEMSRVLLATINVLWLLLSPLPLLDSRVPSLFSFPLSELLSLVFGALLVICSALLLDLLFTVNHTSVPMRQKSVQQRQSGDLTFALFLILSSLWTTGLGIHASAVIVQNRLTPDDPLYPPSPRPSTQTVGSQYVHVWLLWASDALFLDRNEKHVLPLHSPWSNCIWSMSPKSEKRSLQH